MPFAIRAVSLDVSDTMPSPFQGQQHGKFEIVLQDGSTLCFWTPSDCKVRLLTSGVTALYLTRKNHRLSVNDKRISSYSHDSNDVPPFSLDELPTFNFRQGEE